MNTFFNTHIVHALQSPTFFESITTGDKMFNSGDSLIFHLTDTSATFKTDLSKVFNLNPSIETTLAQGQLAIVVFVEMWDISSLERALQQKKEFALFAVKTISRKIANPKFPGYKVELSNPCSMSMNIAVFVKKSLTPPHFLIC